MYMSWTQSQSYMNHELIKTLNLKPLLNGNMRFTLSTTLNHMLYLILCVVAILKNNVIKSFNVRCLVLTKSIEPLDRNQAQNFG